MAFIPEDKISEIRDRANIVSIISHYVHLKKAGVNYKAPCPFHAEKTPSFVVSEAKQIYHCFGCGKGGNVFTFLMEHAGLSFPEAVQKLASEAGVALPEYQISSTQKQNKEKRVLFHKINKAALQFFKQQLLKNKRAQQLLLQRGVTQKTTAIYHLGYAPAGWHELHHFLHQKGISQLHSAEAGLVVSKNQKYYDRFRDRLIFPLFDLSQRVLGFGGRVLDNAASPKYLNSAESLTYQKGKQLYGLSHAVKEGTQRMAREGVVIVEGYFDCILLWQAGFTNVVATMGTAFTQDHILLLKRFTEQFYLLFDADRAGKQAAERSLPLFLKSGISARVVELPEGQDPDDFIRTHKREALIQRFKDAPLLLDFVLGRIMARLGQTVSSKAKIIEEVIPYVVELKNELERQEAVKLISDRLQVEEKWIFKPLQERLLTPDRQNLNWQHQMRVEIGAVELELIEFLMLFPKWLNEVKEQKILDLFSDLEVKTVGLEMMNQYQKMQAIDVPSLLEKIESDDLRKLLSRGLLEKENQRLDQSSWRKTYEGYVKRLQKNHLERLEKKLLLQIKACEKDPQQENQKVELLNQYQQIVKQKQLYH